MTIVFLTPRFYPDIGGVEKHAYEIAKRLSKKNKVVIITEGEKDEKKFLNGIKIIRLFFGKGGWLKKFIIWKKVFGLRSLIEKADIIHCHDVFFWYLPLRLIYPRKKVYITFHGYETVFPIKASAIFIRKLSEKLTNRNIIIGEYIKKWYGTRPDVISYGGVSNFFKQGKLSFSSTPRILFIGRIEKDNGVKIYSETLKKLKRYKFEACGDGTLRKEFETFGKVHGFVKDLEKYIEKSDIVFSSSYLSIITAMSFKKPVFSVYENPLKKDYLSMTPFSRWIYIERSPDAIIRKINNITKNKKTREKNINLAYNWTSKQSWDKLKDLYLTLWKQTI